MQNHGDAPLCSICSESITGPNRGDVVGNKHFLCMMTKYNIQCKERDEALEQKSLPARNQRYSSDLPPDVIAAMPLELVASIRIWAARARRTHPHFEPPTHEETQELLRALQQFENSVKTSNRQQLSV